MELLSLLIPPALFAGLVAVGATVAIERWGGVIGGLLGTLPTTVVPASLGIWAASSDPTTFAAAMGAIPVGMLVNAGFLFLWRVGPRLLPEASLGIRLALMIAVSLSAWAVLALLSVIGLAAASERGLSAVSLGIVALAVNVGVGLAAAGRRVPAPRGRNRVSWLALLSRAGLAGAAIAAATALAWTGDGYLSGVASVFPAIFLTAMVGLWVSQGAAVPAGAVGPMMLGGSSVGAYALLAAFALPALGPVPGVLVAWGLAAACITAPAALWLRWRAAPRR